MCVGQFSIDPTMFSAARMRDIVGSCKFSRISTAGYDESPTLTPSPPLTLFQKASLELMQDMGFSLPLKKAVKMGIRNIWEIYDMVR